RLVRLIARRAFFYMAEGEALCHPTFVDDFVRGVLAAVERGRGDRVYHLAGPYPVTIRALAEAFADALGVAHPRLSLPEGPLRIAARVAERAAGAVGMRVPLT